MQASRRKFVGGIAASSLVRSVVANDAKREIEVLLPRCRVPLSFIIDDSTCLVNMGKFCMPQFAATYPDRKSYQQPWQEWPDEIPDSFVRQFGTWCAENGVKGKYSIVPYPACVGWVDRVIPGWTQKQLRDSLALVRDLMVPNWDIHPEMITHTRVIDLTTGRPFQDYSPAHMENSYPQQDVSVDYLASYLAYALRILKNCDLPCEGITTPGGFGNRVKGKLPLAAFQAVRDVYGTDLPHYFKYIADGDESAVPVAEAISYSASGVPECCMNVLAGTGDWFGGWEGTVESQPDLYAEMDAKSGRMVELIEREEPAIMLCHWPGMYCNGSLSGFRAFQRVVTSLNRRFADKTQWMKVSEIGRYYAARQFTKFSLAGSSIQIDAPWSCKDFTFRITGQASKVILRSGEDTLLREVSTVESLQPGTFFQDQSSLTVCVDLPKGKSTVELL
ncbi:MAG: hypothetical protein Aurels2KO_15510 [Aureliella sp.]